MVQLQEYLSLLSTAPTKKEKNDRKPTLKEDLENRF